MPYSIVISFCLVFSFFQIHALAAIPTKPVDQAQASLPRPVDTFPQTLGKLYRSKKARALRVAYDALQEEEFGDAIRISSRLQTDEMFSDYANWILASAYRGEAQELLEGNKFNVALKLLQKAITASFAIETKNPYSPLIKKLPREIAFSELLIGKSWLGMKKWKESTLSFEKAFQRLQAQNSLILVAPEFIGQYSQACNKYSSQLCSGWLQKFVSVFPKKSEQIKQITQYSPSILEKAKFSKPSYTRLTQVYRAPDLDQVAFEEAMKLYFEEKYSQAIRSFRLFLDDFPRSGHRFRVKYWLAKGLAHEKEPEKAQKLYEEIIQEAPLGYYGFLAAHALSRPIHSNLKTEIPLATDSDPALTPAEIIHVKRAQYLVAEKANDLASIELKDLRPRDAFSNAFIIYLAQLNYEAKNYQVGFQFMTELIQRGYENVFSSFGLRMIFPVDFFEPIKKHSSENSLDPILVLSLIKQESAFDEDANSSVGAMGLMQIMPTTASETDPNLNTPDLLKAESNISTGTRYLRKLLTRFNGNIVLALAAYNAGPSAVDRWLKDIPQKRDMEEFIESIPYRETRDYVGSIIRNYYWYSYKLQEPSPKDLNYFWGGSGGGQGLQAVPVGNTSPPPSSKPQNGSALRRHRTQHTLYLPNEGRRRRE